MTDTEFEQFESYCKDRGMQPLRQILEDLKKLPFDKAKEIMDTLAGEVHDDVLQILKQDTG
jgi:hypothetical protein